MQSSRDNINNVKVNIFAQTNMAVDTNLSIASDDLLISRAEANYERMVENINQKDKQLDVNHNRIR